jgi:hypothetical protein
LQKWSRNVGFHKVRGILRNDFDPWSYVISSVICTHFTICFSTILTRKPRSKIRVGGHCRSPYSDDREHIAWARTCDTCSSLPPPSFNNPRSYYSIPTQLESGLETKTRVCDLWLIPILWCDKTKIITFGKAESLRVFENRVLR